MVPTILDDNPQQIEIIIVSFEEKLGKTRLSSSTTHIQAIFLNPRKLDILNSFTQYQNEFHLDKEDKAQVIKEVIKAKLDYNRHLPWKFASIDIDEKNNLFSIKKKEMPAPLPNTSAPPDNLEHDTHMQDNAANSRHAANNNQPIDN